MALHPGEQVVAAELEWRLQCQADFGFKLSPGVRHDGIFPHKHEPWIAVSYSQSGWLYVFSVYSD